MSSAHRAIPGSITSATVVQHREYDAKHARLHRARPSAQTLTSGGKPLHRRLQRLWLANVSLEDGKSVITESLT